MQFLPESQQNFLVDIYKLVLKFIWKGKGLITARTNLEKINKVGEIILSDVRIGWYWQRDSHTGQ